MVEVRVVQAHSSLVQSGIPLVDPDRCTGCGRCVDACPEGAVRLTNGSGSAVLLIDANACTYCTACEAACPERAIDCPFEIVG